MFQSTRRLAPPMHGRGTNFRCESIRHDCRQIGRQLGRVGLSVRRPFELPPNKTLALQTNSPLKPALAGRIPAETMNGHSIEQFIGKDHAANPFFGEPLPRIEPSDSFTKPGQRLSLPLLSLTRWFENPVFGFLEDLRLV